MFLFRLIVKSGEGAAWSAFGASDKALSYSVFRPLFWCPAPSRWNEGAGDEASKSYRCHTPATSRKPPSQVRPDRNPTDNLSATTTYVNYTFVIKNQQMPLKFLINPLVPASTKSVAVETFWSDFWNPEVKIYTWANFQKILDLLSKISFSGPVPRYMICLISVKTFKSFFKRFFNKKLLKLAIDILQNGATLQIN